MKESKNAVDEEILDEGSLQEQSQEQGNDPTEVLEEVEVLEETPEVSEVPDKAAEYLDRLQRLMAEFDNYRKRSEKEKASIYDLALSNTFTELLPVIDNFERALKTDCQDEKFVEGISMIHKQLINVLENFGVAPIEATNEVFDPNYHNAVLHIEDEAYDENIVVEELQKGYLYKEKVIRHSMVKVAN